MSLPRGLSFPVLRSGIVPIRSICFESRSAACCLRIPGFLNPRALLYRVPAARCWNLYIRYIRQREHARLARPDLDSLPIVYALSRLEGGYEGMPGLLLDAITSPSPGSLFDADPADLNDMERRPNNPGNPGGAGAAGGGKQGGRPRRGRSASQPGNVPLHQQPAAGPSTPRVRLVRC